MKFTVILAPLAILSSFVLAIPIEQDLRTRDIIDSDLILEVRESSNVALDARDYLDSDDLLVERDLDDEPDIYAREPLPASETQKCKFTCVTKAPSNRLKMCLAKC
jgi:hypothetical protein